MLVDFTKTFHYKATEEAKDTQLKLPERLPNPPMKPQLRLIKHLSLYRSHSLTQSLSPQRFEASLKFRSLTIPVRSLTQAFFKPHLTKCNLEWDLQWTQMKLLQTQNGPNANREFRLTHPTQAKQTAPSEPTPK